MGIKRLEAAGHSGEVWVVDNRSVDGSCAMVRAQFPEVRLIASLENLGFSKANNLAIDRAEGNWVLLLNPDTVIQEDTLVKCLSFAEAHPQLGGLGVPMVDGNGRYLPESKRGIPTPAAAFWKISGLYRLAPRSSTLNRYYMGHLPADATNEIEILSGAFMWMRKAALNQVGLLDERYFMYGEDIDLSWRLQKGGWENHYFAGTSIIHYKGESTKKGSLNYVLVFYRAMQIFARTHFSGPGGRAMHALIQCAIYARAALAIASRVFSAIRLPAAEWLLLWGTLVGLLQAYGNWQGIGYDWNWTAPAMGIYALIWLLAIKFQGGYDRPWRWSAIGRGIAAGSLVLLASYGLLPEAARFSRAILLLGTAAVPLILAVTRWIAPGLTGSRMEERPRRLYVSGPEDLGRIRELVRTMDILEPVEMGDIFALHPGDAPMDNHESGCRWLGDLNALNEAIRVHGFNEVIMSGRDVSASKMIQAMSAVPRREVRFRIAWTDGGQIVGAGGPERGAITEHQRAIFKASSRRQKRTLDVLVSVGVMLISPLLLLTRRASWLAAALDVLIGHVTWVGYEKALGQEPSGNRRGSVFQRVEHVRDRVNQRRLLTYVRDYRWTMDLQVIWEALISQRAIHRHGHN